MSQPLAITLATSATVGTAGAGAAVDIGALRRTVVVALSVTGFNPVDQDPEPALVVHVETRTSSAAPWRLADSLSVLSAGAYSLAVGGLDREVRLRWELTNLVSATFAAIGVAHVTYCDPADLPTPAHAIEDVPGDERARACIAISEEMDDYFNSSFVLPLLAWGESARAKAARLSLAQVFRWRGVDAAGPDKQVFTDAKDATSWLERIADGKLKPPGIVDQTPQKFEGGGVVVVSSGRPRRGW